MSVLPSIPHLAIGPITVRYDIGDELARKHGIPMVPTACGLFVPSTLSTRTVERVRCRDCKTLSRVSP